MARFTQDNPTGTCITVNCADVISARDRAIKSIKKVRGDILDIEIKKLTDRRWFPVSPEKASGMIDMVWINVLHGRQEGICENLKAMAEQSLDTEMLLSYGHFENIKNHFKKNCDYHTP